MTVIFGKVYIYHNNTMLYVKRIIKEDFNPVIDKWKELLDCDLVLKKEGKLYFCQTINEAEIIEDEQV
jgi:uncharacterized pyridoxamine 5'-phosphate oxidase family protein